jgi:hypothetical protein
MRKPAVDPGMIKVEIGKEGGKGKKELEMLKSDCLGQGV